MITNIDTDRESYHEVPQTPPLTTVSNRSLHLPIQEPPQALYSEMSARRQSLARPSESWELMEIQKRPKATEIKGER